MRVRRYIFIGVGVVAAAVVSFFLVLAILTFTKGSSGEVSGANVTDNREVVESDNNETVGKSMPQPPVEGEVKSSTTSSAATPNKSQSSAETSSTIVKKRSFSDNFVSSTVIEESSSMTNSKSANWWLNSGAYFYNKSGYSSTVNGSLPTSNKWCRIYSSSNPEDTDNGIHPQNIFRLVQKQRWLNYNQIAYFKVNRANLSDSSNRSESNGLLLFNRYQDGDNLYYTGIRVDGTAVIKKKQNGTYYTMAQKAIFPGRYNHDTNPNLLPTGKWLGLKSKVWNTGATAIKIELYLDQGSGWIKILETTDNGISYGSKAINTSGYAGIRTDFLDVDFKKYFISEL